MEKANHSSFSPITLLSNCDSSFFSGSNHRKMNGLKLPSYVGISCAISGYSGYIKYCSSNRGSMSRENSPLKLSKMLADSHINGRSKMKKQSNLETRFVSDQVDFVKSDLLVNQDDEESKSLVQQRIESLYGQSFADCWRDSRSKHKIVRKNASDFNRSPSCPPYILESKKNLAVFNHLTKDFIDQLNSDQKVFKVSNSLNEEKKVNGQVKKNLIIDIKPVKNVSEIKNGKWYLNQLDQTCNEINKKIEKSESYLKEESYLMNEEVLGLVRSSVGKANLLMTQKLKQFRELCLKNINQNLNDEFETRNQDLEGFWEMVYIQVENVFKTFEQIDKMKDNKWQFEKVENNFNSHAKPLKKTSSSKIVALKNDKSVFRDEQRKNRLKEAKEKQAAKLHELSEEIMIFTSSKDDVTNKSSSIEKTL